MLSELKNSSRFKDFWRPAFSVLAGVGIAQILPILSYIYLATAVGPSAFGQFSLWLGVVYLGGVISTLRLENAIFIEEEGTRRISCLVAIIHIVGLAGLFLLAVLSFLIIFMPVLLPDIPLNLWVFLIPAIVALSLNTTIQSFTVSNGDYGQVNRLRIFQAGAVVIIQLIVVWFSAEAVSMVAGFTFGQLLCIAYALTTLDVDKKSIFRPKNPVPMVKKHWRFPSFSLPADSLSSLGALLPVALIGSHYGPVAAGQIALTIRVLGAPVGLLGRAILDVFKRQAVLEQKATGSCEKLYWNILLVLLPIMVLFVAVLYWLSPIFFEVLFGPEWVEAGRMSQILAPVFALGLAASPLSYIVYLVGKQYIDMLWQAVLVAVVWLALTFFSTQTTTIIAYSIAYSAMYVVYLIISYQLCRGERHS